MWLCRRALHTNRYRGVSILKSRRCFTVLHTCGLGLPRILVAAVLVSAALSPTISIGQQPQAVPVHHVQGTSHAFLVLRSEAGEVLGYGELLQLIHGDRVNSRLIYRFRDGSLDDDTTVFSQRGVFHLISDHHIQHGPFFSKGSDSRIDEGGTFSIRTIDKNGKEKVDSSHIELPVDVCNGFTGTVLLNLPANAGPLKLDFVAPIGKGRLIQLSTDVEGQESYTPILGVHRKATVFRIHPELGGVVGVIAPVLGKEPKDVFIWVLEGQVPGLVREVGPLEQGGQVISVEAAGASFPLAGAIQR